MVNHITMAYNINHMLCIMVAHIYQSVTCYVIGPRVGAKPRPDPRPFIQLNDFINIANGYMVSHMVWAHWPDGYAKSLHIGGGPGVEPHGLP
jgi:hypothetical protein